MINDEFSLQLTQNVANALLERITVAGADALVSEDLARLRRLVDAGHLNKKVVRQALHNIANNETLGAAIREAAAMEVANDFQVAAIKSASPGGVPGGRRASGGSPNLSLATSRMPWRRHRPSTSRVHSHSGGR